MESNYHGAENKAEFFRKWNLQKTAIFTEIRNQLIATNAKSYTRDEAFAEMARIAAENKKRIEQQNQQDQNDHTNNPS